MYKTITNNLWKHIDFLIVDCICIQAACILGFWNIDGVAFPYSNYNFVRAVVVITCFEFLVGILSDCYSNILKRNFWQELKVVVKQTAYFLILFMFYLHIAKEEMYFSYVLAVKIVIVMLGLMFAGRELWKYVIRHHSKWNKNVRSMFLVTTRDRVQSILNDLKKYSYNGTVVTGIALPDAAEDEYFGDIPVVSDVEHFTERIKNVWVDEVFVALPPDVELKNALIDGCKQMGITIHVELTKLKSELGHRQIVERLGSYSVLSTSVNTATVKQLLFKRLLDILGGLAGCLATGLLTIVIGPFIYIKSPGPIFFSQLRIGKNGKTFKMYKFRSMYLDAEERKAELMKHNEVKDGFMFKMENDPRIIGGEKGKGIGNFIRNTSLDEFPQFFNVLKGDMSLVGTRQPTLDEWEKYELHHRMRMAFKPGLTGMWQVSGRSDITDFEEVVRLDGEYIKNWSFGLDIKILLQTVLVVLTGKGAR